MKKIIGIFVIGVVAFFLVLGITRSRQAEEVYSIARIHREEGVPVLAAKVVPATIEVTRQYYGDLKADQEADVSSKLMERIDRILYDVGDRVVRGSPVVRFDTTATQASVVQLRLAMENAEKDFQRVAALWEEGAVSRQLYDSAKLALDLAAENYSDSHHAVELKAPISGRISRIDFRDGQVVHPGDVILTIITDRTLEVEFDVPQEDRILINPGTPIRVTLKSGEYLKGEVTSVDLATTAESRLFRVKGKIDASPGLFPGMMVIVEVTLRRRDQVLSVTADAVIDRNGEPHVAVIADSVAHLRHIRTGLHGAEQIEITDGLHRGEMVATYGHDELEEGMKVKVVKGL